MKALYAFIAVAGFGFFLWLLVQMASGADGASSILSALGVSFVLVLGAMGAAALMSRRDEPDPDRD
jgi:NADH:ubiquinone oxidoreductase subunit 2 (subunit N)